MSYQDESVLVSGLYPKKNPNSPDFVLCNINIKLDQFAEHIRDFKKREPDAEWLSVDVQMAKSGKPYAKENNWKPSEGGQAAPAAPAPVMAPVDDDLPF
jgi:hypothetical protein